MMRLEVPLVVFKDGFDGPGMRGKPGRDCTVPQRLFSGSRGWQAPFMALTNFLQSLAVP